MNLLLVLQLALFSIVLLFIWNSYNYSNRYLHSVEDRDYRFLYYSNISSGTEEEGIEEEKVTVYQEIKEKLKEIPYKGISLFDTGVMFVNDSLHFQAHYQLWTQSMQGKEPEPEVVALVEEAVAPQAYYYDQRTLDTFSYDMEKGTWFQEEHKKPFKNGSIPCVIGGKKAGEYEVGQELKGETFGKGGSQFSKGLEVIGIMKQPEYILNNSKGATGQMQLEEIFDPVMDQDIFLILPKDQCEIEGMNDISYDNCFVYFDKNCKEEQLQQAADRLGRGYVTTDAEMIELEKKEVKDSLDKTFPFVVSIVVVSFVGILAMTLLTTIRNLKVFYIYYLVGATRRKTIRISILFSCCYLFFSFLFMLCFLPIVKEQLGFRSYYVFLDNTFLAILGGIYSSILVMSIGIPFYLLWRRTIPVGQINEK